MKKQINKIIVTIISVIFSIFNIFVTNTPTLAAGRAFTLSPMRQKIVLIPGETYYGSISISNPATSEENFYYLVTVGSYSVKAGQNSKDDYGDWDPVTISNMNAIMDWIKIDNPSGKIEPNEKKVISFSIEVPEDAPAGGQYASLMIQENPDMKEPDGSTTIQEILQMSHIIYAEVAGKTITKGSITENNMPSFLTANVLEATSMVRNDGNVHTDASYILQVWPLFSDEEICTNEEDPSTSLILPETERYHTESCTLPPVGIFKAKQTVEIFGEISTLEKTIIVCPLWLLFVVIFAIIAIIIYFVVRAKSRRKRQAE